MVVTVSLTLDYIRNCRPGSRIRVTSHVLHCGRTTMCIGAEMYDEEDRLMANLLASMMVVGSFPESRSSGESDTIKNTELLTVPCF